MNRTYLRPFIVATGILLSTAATAFVAMHGRPRDPGLRALPVDVGGTYAILDNTSPVLDREDKEFFTEAEVRLRLVNSVSGRYALSGRIAGLGPAYNGVTCAMCHSQPVNGGSSPEINPQLTRNFAHYAGAANPEDLSGILSMNGPARVVRFIRKPDGTPDGSVHDIFTIAGRPDAPGCTLPQPDFRTELAKNNLTFRIPTPSFGLGLVENTPDATLQANLDSNAFERSRLGIGGRFNRDAKGAITRFGWKAQTRSLMDFDAEAYNVEQGVTNELFPKKRFPDGTPAVVVKNSTFGSSIDDGTDLSDPFAPGHRRTADECPAIVAFAAFTRMLAPPEPTTHTALERRGGALFSRVGCVDCHSATLTSGKSEFPALTGMTYHPYSDFALHHMGPGLADGIRQGDAAPDEFRTAPLWGVGQRIFFLHDGRTSDLLDAIEQHASRPNAFNRRYGPSEANAVIDRFNALSWKQQQEVLDFLRSL